MLGPRSIRFWFASGEAEASAARRRIGGEPRLVSPFFPILLDLCPDQVRQRRIGLQGKRLAWQVALKLDAPLIRQASHTDSLDQECQRHVGDRQRVLPRDTSQRDIDGAWPDDGEVY